MVKNAMKLFLANDPDDDVSTRYWIESGKKLRIEEYRGPIELDDWRSMASAIASDPCYSPDHNGLIDFTAASLRLSTNDVMRMGLLMRRTDFLSNGWQVFVVGSSADFGIIRMLGRWARNEERLRIFNQRNEADAWLLRHSNIHPFRVPAIPTPGGSALISA